MFRNASRRRDTAWSLLIVFAAAVVIVGCTTSASPPVPPTHSLDTSTPASETRLAKVGVGSNTTLFADAQAVERSMRSMRDLGVSILRLDIAWPLVEPAPGLWNWEATDRVVDAATKHGIEVLAIVDYTPAWHSGVADRISARPRSSVAFGNYAGEVAEHFKGRVKNYEIWNEPNGSFFFSPRPDPVFYAAMLRASYRAIKAVDRTATVIGGAVATAVDSSMTINGLRFVRAMYASGAGRFLDALSLHPYSYPDAYTYDPVDPQSTMRMVTDIYAVMRAHGDAAKKIWATEIGFPTAGDPLAGIDRQADVLTTSIKQWSQLSFAGPVVIHELRDRASGSTDREDAFGLLTTEFAPKPAYFRLKALIHNGGNDDPQFQRNLGAASRARFDIGGTVTPWFRFVTDSGRRQTRQEFVSGVVICSTAGCFASPTEVATVMGRLGYSPAGPFADGRQDVDGPLKTTVFYTPSTGAHPLGGDMLDAWNSEFGFPVTDEYRDGDVRVVRCERAVMRQSGGRAPEVRPS